MRLKLPGCRLFGTQAVTRKTPLVIVPCGVRAHPEGVQLGSDQHNQAHAPVSWRSRRRSLLVDIRCCCTSRCFLCLCNLHRGSSEEVISKSASSPRCPSPYFHHHYICLLGQNAAKFCPNIWLPCRTKLWRNFSRYFGRLKKSPWGTGLYATIA